jgi:hypothetical protein
MVLKFIWYSVKKACLDSIRAYKTFLHLEVIRAEQERYKQDLIKEGYIWQYDMSKGKTITQLEEENQQFIASHPELFPAITNQKDTIQ